MDIKLFTIQNKKILKLLDNNKPYYANFNNVISKRSNLYTPYKDMAKYYNWTNAPIFCASMEPGYVSYIHGYAAPKNEAIGLLLSVPEKYIKRQYYYDWTDYIYFTEFRNEFYEGAKEGYTFEQFKQDVFDCTNLGSYQIFQYTIPYINPKWIIKKFDDISFINNFDYITDEVKPIILGNE